jgi:adenylate cyclase
MQLAMQSVNEYVRQEDLPEVEMGIGINTGQVIVGNIGSAERLKYGVVGSQVNLTSRIQSCTTGGQVLISDATRRELGTLVRLGQRMEIKAKGIALPVTLHEVLGIGGRHKLYLPATSEPLVRLPQAIAFKWASIEGERVDDKLLDGKLVSLSSRGAEILLPQPMATLTNLLLQFSGRDGALLPGALYAKVVRSSADNASLLTLRFSSMSPEVDAFLRSQSTRRGSHGA